MPPRLVLKNHDYHSESLPSEFPGSFTLGGKELPSHEKTLREAHVVKDLPTTKYVELYVGFLWIDSYAGNVHAIQA